MEEVRVKVTLSSGFWKYHRTILGEIGEWSVVKSNSNTTTVEFDKVALMELKFSAKRLTDPGFIDMRDPECRAEMRRAERVLLAIDKVEKALVMEVK